jgi:hypothetical protein
MLRALASDQTPRGSAPNKSKVSYSSRKNREIGKTSYPSKETYRCRREDQFAECATRPRQPALKGVARRSLLVVLGVVAGLEGGRPRGGGKLEDLGLAASSALQQSRARIHLGLLDLWGGSPCHTLEGVALPRGHRGLAWYEDLLYDSGNWSGRRWLRSSDNTLSRADHRSSGRDL